MCLDSSHSDIKTPGLTIIRCECVRPVKGNALYCRQIVFEGQVGANNLGDIAIDDISIIQGACPSESRAL